CFFAIKQTLLLQDTPVFYPILRHALGIAGLKDPLDVFFKFNPHPVLMTCGKFQGFLLANADRIGKEQNVLGAKIREVDAMLSAVNAKAAFRQKQFMKLCCELATLTELSADIAKISVQMRDVISTAAKINDMLPANDRLPYLTFPLHVQRIFVPPGTEEQKVAPIQLQRLVTFFNFWLTRNISFINGSLQMFQDKMIDFENRLSSMEISLELIEAKLQGIPEPDQTAPPMLPPQVTENSATASAEEEVTVPEKQQDEATSAVVDPQLQKYLKMLQLGVPVLAVKQRMMLDEVDPTLIDKYLDKIHSCRIIEVRSSYAALISRLLHYKLLPMKKPVTQLFQMMNQVLVQISTLDSVE
ncbi:unnamed protein product, partial [Soboliphyme baturini]|uniref:BLOC-1-related complex subunit 5 n=1 Tax=Soboliphyme baturini TaxID=241478 RepID=A0A183ITJ7_9BILA